MDRQLPPVDAQVTVTMTTQVTLNRAAVLTRTRTWTWTEPSPELSASPHERDFFLLSISLIFWQNMNPAGSFVLHPVVSPEASLANYTFLPYACFTATTLQFTHTHTHTPFTLWMACVFKNAPRVMKNVKSLHRIKVNPDWRAKQKPNPEKDSDRSWILWRRLIIEMFQIFTSSGWKWVNLLCC